MHSLDTDKLCWQKYNTISNQAIYYYYYYYYYYKEYF